MNSNQESVDKAVEYLNKDKYPNPSTGAGVNARMLHPNTFEYLKPTEKQMALMNAGRAASEIYATALEHLLPNSPDKTYALRKLREVAMWANIAITRNPDGSPRN